MSVRFTKFVIVDDIKDKCSHYYQRHLQRLAIKPYYAAYPPPPPPGVKGMPLYLIFS